MSSYGPKPQPEPKQGPDVGTPGLDRLEERIRRLAESIERLRKDRTALEADLLKLKQENERLYNSNNDLKFEYEQRMKTYEVLDKNREEIKHRIDALVRKLEGLGG